MQTHIIKNGIVATTIMATVAQAAAAFPDAQVRDAALGGAIGDSWNGTVFSKPPVDLSTLQAALIKRIDEEADAIYGAVLGNRATEYSQAEAEAGAYRDAGYAGDVPATISDWASTKGQSSTWAANDILTTAAGWRAAQMAIRSNRLARKEQARAADTQIELGAAAVAWEQFRTYIATQLGV
jgi:hypothetical protein